jgi:hypothetical protein
MGRSRLRSAWIAVGVLALSVASYVPYFIGIVREGRRYAPSAEKIDLDRLLSAMRSFPIDELSASFIAQAEPLLWPLVFFTGLGFAVSLNAWLRGHRDGLKHLIGVLFIGHVFIYAIVFNAATSLPLRPPYLVMLLPMMLLLSALGLNGVWYCLKTRLPILGIRLIPPATALAVAIWMTPALLDARNVERKPDWRGIADEIRSRFGGHHLILLDSFSGPSSWKPYGYGFDRYDAGNATRFPLRKIVEIAPSLDMIDAEPVLLFFNYGDYRLTSLSSVPLIPSHNIVDGNALSMRLQDVGLNAKHRTGFTLITLKNNSGDFIVDTQHLLKSVAGAVDDGKAKFDIHLALATLALWCEPSAYAEHRSQVAEHAAKTRENELKRLDELNADGNLLRPESCEAY